MILQIPKLTRVFTANMAMLDGLYLLQYNAVQSVENKQTFQKNMSPPTSPSKNKTSDEQMLSRCRALLDTCFIPVSCLVYTSIVKIGAICSSETSVYFNGLHVVILQEPELFITTAVRTLYCDVYVTNTTGCSSDDWIY
jgi:hypothetical protein